MASVLGAQLYTIRDHTKTAGDMRVSMERVRGLGYEAVQVSGQGTDISDAEIAKMMADNGLTVAATHIRFDAIRDDPQRVIDQHGAWGCRHVGIGSMPGDYTRDADGFTRFAREASAAAAPLIEAGLTFSYHNHSFELERMADGRTGLQTLVDESVPGLFCFEIDTYWIQHGGGNPVSWLRALEGRMPLVHLKDMAMRGGEQLFAEVGEGNLEWAGILDACREGGVEWYLVEQDICQGDPFDALGLSFDNLRGMGVQ